jgi:N-acetylmuramoyl-L-alanine amidase
MQPSLQIGTALAVVHAAGSLGKTAAMRLRNMLPLAATAILAAPAAAQANVMHTVMPGETLTGIAARDGLTVAQLAAANGISRFTKLISGSTIAIPAPGAPVSTAKRRSAGSTSVCDGDADGDDTGCSTTSAASTSTGSTSAAGGSYVVARGDTLSAIAARAGTTVSALAALNGLNPRHYLLYGTVLRLPGGSATATGSVASSEPVGNAAVGSLNAPPYPTHERLSAGQIGSIAAANGVPSSLAEAIGWQESGFNNAAVSPAGARGVMQILPGTWNWIGSVLNRGGVPLAPASALDNVRGGVIMLHALLGATGGNQAQAAAGYYQGLSSVQQHGMYSDTQQYVRDVMALSQRFGGG